MSNSFPSWLEDSVTYQDIIAKGEAIGRAKVEAEGRAETAQKWLIRLERKKFGEPDAETLNILQSLTDLERLEQLLYRLLEVETWVELLAE